MHSVYHTLTKEKSRCFSACGLQVGTPPGWSRSLAHPIPDNTGNPAWCFSFSPQLSGTKIASQNRNDHGGRRQARNHFAAEIAGFSASPAVKKSLAASDFGMQPQLAFKVAGKLPILKGRDFLHPIFPPSYRSQTSSWSQLSHFQVHYRFSRDQCCHFIVKRIFVGKTCLRVGYQSVWGFPVRAPDFWILHSISIKFQGSLHECEQVRQERHDTQTSLLNDLKFLERTI